MENKMVNTDQTVGKTTTESVGVTETQDKMEHENTRYRVLNPKFRYWAITKQIADSSYTGKARSEIVLVECETAIELDSFIAGESISSGESMGSYFFDVMTLYCGSDEKAWYQFSQEVKWEQNANKMREIEKKIREEEQ